MIRINLLPFRTTRKKENIRRQVTMFFLSFLLVVIAVVYFNSYLSGKIEKLNTQISETKAQVAKYNKINKEIAEIKKKLDILNKKIEVIQSLDADRKHSIKLLDSMTKLIMADRMWFTQLKTQGDNVDVAGIAIDNKTIADFMTRLETSEEYTAVTLKTIKQEPFGGKDINLKSFNISFSKKVPLKKPDEEKANQS